MATRVFELANEIGVTSKQILGKCRAEGLELKNHMAALSAGLEATIREWFSEAAGATAVETSDHVDLKIAREEAKKTRRRRKGPAEGAAPQEQEPAEAVEAAVAVVAEEEASPLPVAEVETATEVSEPAEAIVASDVPATAVAEASAPQAPPQELAKEAEPEAPALPEVVRRPLHKTPVKAAISPAGPQVVPRPAVMKGPRVVRVEKPDVIRQPTRRPPMAPPAEPTMGGAGRRTSVKSGPVTETEEEARKKGKKRTPRRRGSRTADSGEQLKEWREKDLAERSQRLAAASGGTLRRHRATVAGKPTEGGHAAEKFGPVEIEEPITVKNLSAATGIKSSAFIRKLMEKGILATVNQVIDREIAEAVLLENNIELVIKRAKSAEEQLVEKLDQRKREEPSPRPPVVTFLGHVDHGKTSLLDRIRNTGVAAGEAGGITQHIGAYRYDVGDKHVVFLDTPGHEAFTAMRARGANMTDVVVLVVAADDGVMPQTVEAISHAKAAKVPIIVALNKVDVPNANVQRAMGQLAEYGLTPREWGGNVEVIQTSAVTGLGVDSLVETLSLEAELLELRAEKNAPASGFVIEAHMDPGLGAVARLLVLNGTLKVGGVLLAGCGYGRVRQMTDDHGRVISEAGPATPVEVSGLDEVPAAGDRFYVVESIDDARVVAEDHRANARTASLGSSRHITLENLLSEIQAGNRNELALIVKADVQGTLEALVGSLKKLGTDEVGLNVMHSAVGGISTGDVALAEASGAIIVGFNVVPDSIARQQAEAKGVDIRLYRIIYDLLEDVRTALSEGLAPEIRMNILGHALVRQVFKVSKVGTVAGAFVTDGSINRNAKLRITRNNIVVEDERTLESLKRFKDDVRDVRSGLECGIKVAGYDDIKEGDVLEFYQQVEVARRL
ncbi:MAG: translation initiation factor IF-2 [Phycisphaerae bacterium]